MKKTILPFLLGIFVATTLAFNTTELLTVRPATPKSVLVKPFWGSFGIQEDITDYIKENVRKGYILKELCLDSEENGYQRGVVVMEKY